MKKQLFGPLKTADTFKDKTVNLIAQAILSGRIAPGERLNESRLAREFQISRTPIREALLELIHQGLVVNGDRRGMFVVSLTDSDVVEINSLRVLLEAEALRLTRDNATPQNCEKLKKMLKRLESLATASIYEQTQADLEFHQAIWSLAGNDYLEKILNTLTAPLMAHAMLRTMQTQKRKAVLLSHRPL